MNKFNLDQAVVLAGGRGERLRPLTDHRPKPLAFVLGVPFLDYLIQSLIDAGFHKILFLLGYKAEMIRERYGRTVGQDILVEYSVGTQDDQTGRRVLNAYHLLDNHFMLLYGDNYWPMEIEQMKQLYERKGAWVMTTVFNNRNATSEYGPENNCEVGEDRYVKRYDKTRRSQGLNGVDMGYFIVKKSALDPRLTGNISFEQDILPQFIGEGQLIAYLTDRQYYFMTSLKTLGDFEKAVRENNFRPLDMGVRI